jgi:membrane fusion protein (multidrug efflux system)
MSKDKERQVAPGKRPSSVTRPLFVAALRDLVTGRTGARAAPKDAVQTDAPQAVGEGLHVTVPRGEPAFQVMRPFARKRTLPSQTPTRELFTGMLAAHVPLREGETDVLGGRGAPVATLGTTPPPEPSPIDVPLGAKVPPGDRDATQAIPRLPPQSEGSQKRAPAPMPVSAPAVAAQRTRVSVQSPIFRAEALAAYRRGERASSVLRITSVSRWAVLGAVGLGVALALGVVGFCSIEERGVARGVLRAPFGVQPVVPQVGGTVHEVFAAAGEHVEAGQLLVRLDATPLAAQEAEAEERYLGIESQWQRQRFALVSGFERSAALTHRRIQLLTARQQSQTRRIDRRAAAAERMHAPDVVGVVELSTRDQTLENLDSAQDELLRMSDEISNLQLQLATRRSDQEQQLAAGEERVREAKARLEATRTMRTQTELRAPMAGTLESLRIQQGQTVQPGEWVARVVRDVAPDTMDAFLPERFVAFLQAGAEADVEVDKLPVTEFGFGRAQVTRVAGELADAAELKAALGDAAPQGAHVRVELGLVPGAATDRIRAYLRPGTLVTARIALRDRRLLSIVFEPVRKWLQP